MKRKLLEVLACPDCTAELELRGAGIQEETVTNGELHCRQCDRAFVVRDGIPRFVADDNYASSFGFQWNKFRNEQMDSVNHTSLSARRFWSETDWPANWNEPSWILDAGCGAGRFLEIAARSGAQVVGMDVTNAVDAAKANLGERDNLHFVQASIFRPPFRKAAFDACYCIGVIQHTPEPDRALRCLVSVLNPGARLALTIYERNKWTLLNGKYLVRPITRRLNKRFLFTAISVIMPVAFVCTEILFRIPKLGRFFSFFIPIANYVHNKELSLDQRYRWALLDTFDMLSPQYDQPQTADGISNVLADAGMGDVRRLPNPGLNVVGTKR